MVAPLLRKMKVEEIINQHLPADPQAEFDFGRILTVLIAARMYSPIALMNVGKWAAETGADMLWNIPAEKLNDDRLGKALDAFFTQRHSILASFALHVSQELGVPLREVHYDPTHILFHGAYDQSEARDKMPDDESIPSDAKMPAAHITKAHIIKKRRMEDARVDHDLRSWNVQHRPSVARMRNEASTRSVRLPGMIFARSTTSTPKR